MARRDDSPLRPVAGHVAWVMPTVKVWPRALTSAHVSRADNEVDDSTVNRSRASRSTDAPLVDPRMREDRSQPRG
jgi:hypothetical protein